ncbi:MAG: hypothetical protein ACRC10_11760 [Thermoguttaceae bacterium]
MKETRFPTEQGIAEFFVTIRDAAANEMVTVHGYFYKTSLKCLIFRVENNIFAPRGRNKIAQGKAYSPQPWVGVTQDNLP